MLTSEFDPTTTSALVLDDKHYDRAVSLDQLRALGLMRVVGAANVTEAWDTLRRVNPDLIFLEWLRDGDALDFVRKVRAGDAPNRSIPIFMLTARSAKADVVAAREAGVDGYLRKPITASGVQKRVQRVVAQPQQFIVTETYVGPCRRRERKDYVHTGPWRRFSDEPSLQSEQDDDLGDIKLELARARVAALTEAARDFSSNDAAAVRGIHKAAQELVVVADQIGDGYLALGGKELMRYIEAQGATERLDPTAVGIHISALHQLVHLPEKLGAERDRVAQSLRRMVDKKLRASGAA